MLEEDNVYENFPNADSHSENKVVSAGIGAKDFTHFTDNIEQSAGNKTKLKIYYYLYLSSSPKLSFSSLMEKKRGHHP